MKKISFALCFVLIITLLSGCQLFGLTPVLCISKVTQTYSNGSIITVDVDCDRSGNAMKYTIKGGDSGTFQYGSYAYTYDSRGNVLTETRTTSMADQPHVTTYQYDDHGNLISTNNSKDSYWDYTYDENGIMIEKRSFLSGKLGTIWTYDSNGNLTEEYLSDTSHFLYSYNAQDLLTASYQVVDDKQVLSATYTYSEEGLLLQSIHYTVSNNAESQLSYTETYTYDAQGNLLEKYKDGVDNYEKTTWTYDSAGRKLTESYTSDCYPPHYTEWAYDQNGNLTQLLNNNIEYTWRYDTSGNLIGHTYSSGGFVCSFELTYTTVYLPADAAGRVQALQSKLLEYLRILGYFRAPELP